MFSLTATVLPMNTRNSAKKDKKSVKNRLTHLPDLIDEHSQVSLASDTNISEEDTQTPTTGVKKMR